MLRRLCLVLLVAASPCAGCAATSRAPAASSAGTWCVVDYAKPQPCSMQDHVDAHLVHSMSFKMGSRTMTFTGKAQTGWWSGTLDGKPAMGYELNRGHVVYSTSDLGTTFEWWYAGMQHGNY